MKCDANDILREHGPDALRAEFDRARKYEGEANGHEADDGPDTPPRRDAQRFRLVPFHELKVNTAVEYLIKNLIPRVGIVVAWGPPKCGKSFFICDAVLHAVLGWLFRGRKVVQGTAVYCAFEGASAFGKRADAFRLHHGISPEQTLPFFLMSARMDLVKDHAALIKAIREQHVAPDIVVLDTLNRSLHGSESKDEDMTAYIAAADAIREAFGCVVIIVHHCGVDGTRPRGHTSLTGAVDAQLAVKRTGGNIITEVEWMKDGPEGDTIVSRLEVVDVGINDEGDTITSCVVVPSETTAEDAATPEPKLTKNQQTLFSLLHAAGSRGLSTEEWNDQARDAGLGLKRKADLFDLRASLKAKNLIRCYGDRWTVAHSSRQSDAQGAPF